MSKKLLFAISIIFQLFVFSGTVFGEVGLIGWYKFNEISGTTANDDSGYDNHGTLGGSAEWAPGEGFEGGAVSFSNARGSDHVEIPTTSMSPSSMTIVLRAKLVGPEVGTRYIFGHTSNPSGGYVDRVQLYMDGAVMNTELDLGLGDNHTLDEAIVTLDTEVWYHLALAWSGGTYNLYVDGVRESSGSYSGLSTFSSFMHVGNSGQGAPIEAFDGLIDDVRIYNRALSEPEIQSLYSPTKATNPIPSDGATDIPVDVTVSWTGASGATMRNVYFGTDACSPPLLYEEWPSTSFGPNTLDVNTTYYWRIDEIEGSVTTTGDEWSFTTEPGRATDPEPINGADFVPLNVILSWSAGIGAESHDVYMGTEPGSLVLEEAGLTIASYEPGVLEPGTTYYWRIDENNASGGSTGDIWNFKTEGKAYNPNPGDQGGNVATNQVLSWSAGIDSGVEDVYFGTDFDEVNDTIRPYGDVNRDNYVDFMDIEIFAEQWLSNPEGLDMSADINLDGNVNMIDLALIGNDWRGWAGDVFKGTQALVSQEFNPGTLAEETTYYWRVDEIKGARRYRGDVWSFTTLVPDLAAFPSAEGWASTTPGGRGGEVIKVTNLNASGPGSLAAACATSGPRIVVFEVSGVINGTVNITEPYITIAGQTAPGGGITIEGMVKSYGYAVHDVIIRHVRVRPLPTTGSGGDAFQLGGVGTYNIILDHCSMCWGNDEVVDFYNAHDMSVQWCTIEESDPEGHPKGEHNFGMISAATDCGAVSVHHNLWAHHYRRVPCMAPYRSNAADDFRNNLVYDCYGGLTHDGHSPGIQSPLNNLNNYWKRGPSCWTKIYPFATITGVDYYIDNNYFEDWGIQGPPQYWTYGSTPSWVQFNNNGNAIALPGYVPPITTDPVMDVCDIVLEKAGAWPRDRVTLRTIDEVINGTGSYGRDAPAAPSDAWFMDGLTPTAPPVDNDNDGMPDDWETAHGLNPGNPADATTIVPAGASPGDRHKNYTYIEYYINELADNLVP